MRLGLISSLATAVTMRLSNPRGVDGGRTLAKGSLPKSSTTSNSIEPFFPPMNSSRRRISIAASPSAPPSPTRDGGASSSKGGPLRSLHAHHDHHQQQRGHAAAAASAAAASVAEAPSVVDFADVEIVGPLPTTPQPPPPLRVSFASFPRFETAFPNALSSRRRSLLDEASGRNALILESSPSPFADEIGEKPPSTSTSTSKKPTLAAAPHDSKLALFYNVYGPPPTEAAGRGESARAARDALALFHAVYGPPRQAEEELSSSSSSPSRSSLSPLQLQRAAASSPASSCSSPASSSLSPRATTTIAALSPSSPSSARRRLHFSKPLARGVVLERPNRFTMRVRLVESDEVVNCHCPVTGALGGLGMGAFEGAGAPCLVSRVADEDEETKGGESSSSAEKKKKRRYYARKTPFTVEAVSLADPRGPPSWVGINQMAANRYIEHFWNAGALPELSSSSPSSGSSSSSSSSGPSASADENVDDGENNGTSPSLVRETRIKDTRSRLDFTASGGRDLVEVKCPLDALPLLRDDSSESSSSSSSSSTSTSSSAATKIRPNPVLAAAAALRAQTAGERLARLPRAKRAAMYERAARHASVLAEHLATAKKRERAAALRATRARKRARARAAKRQAAEAAAEAFSPASSSSLQQALASREEGNDDEDNDLLLEGTTQLEGEQEQRARALLIQCFQFDAPPVRGMLPPPKGADPSSDGRAAVAAAMRSAARAGVETWQVNMRFDELGVELLDCFRLDLFPSTEASDAASSSSFSASKAKKEKENSTRKTKSSSSSSLAAPTAALAAAAPTASSPSSSFKESFSSLSSSSSSGDELDDGGALFAA